MESRGGERIQCANDLSSFFRATQTRQRIAKMEIEAAIDDPVLTRRDTRSHQPCAVVRIVVSRFQNETVMDLQ